MYYMIFPGIIAAEQKVIAAAIMIALFVFTCFLLQLTPAHFQSKPSSDFALS